MLSCTELAQSSIQWLVNRAYETLNFCQSTCASGKFILKEFKLRIFLRLKSVSNTSFMKFYLDPKQTFAMSMKSDFLLLSFKPDIRLIAKHQLPFLSRLMNAQLLLKTVILSLYDVSILLYSDGKIVAFPYYYF